VPESYWRIPFPLDYDFGPLDLMESEWHRSAHTLSVNESILSLGSGCNGRRRKEGVAHRGARVFGCRR
jgi:hypothetical protein